MIFSVGQYLLRLALMCPVGAGGPGLAAHSMLRDAVRILSVSVTLVGGSFTFVCVALSILGLIGAVVGRRVGTVLGVPGFAMTCLFLVTGTSFMFWLAPPEVVAARLPARAMTRVVEAVRGICAEDGRCPKMLDGRRVPSGVRTLQGRGWEYRACSGTEFAIFVGSCWVSECRILTWSTGSCCTPNGSHVEDLGGGWTVRAGDESEEWIDAQCSASGQFDHRR
jgi:hypothetical protein